MSTPVRGEVERVNDRGLCISDEWYNYSKWIKQRAQVGDLVEFEVKEDEKGTNWIQSIKFLRKAQQEISDKDIRISRLSLISSAVEMLKKNGRNGKNPETEEEIIKAAQKVIIAVREFEKFVYEPRESEDIPF